MNVYSGGQPSAGNGPRVGSIRHDHGNAGDVTFHQNGRMLDWNNPADLPTLSNIVAQARANGVTGIGAGNDYMGPGRFHVGFGAPAVWGAGGKSANAPEWLRSAYYGAPARPAPALAAINAAVPPAAPAAPVMRPAPPAQALAYNAPVMRPAQPGGRVQIMPTNWASKFGSDRRGGPGSAPKSLVAGPAKGR